MQSLYDLWYEKNKKHTQKKKNTINVAFGNKDHIKEQKYESQFYWDSLYNSNVVMQ